MSILMQISMQTCHHDFQTEANRDLLFKAGIDTAEWQTSGYISWRFGWVGKQYKCVQFVHHIVNRLGSGETHVQPEPEVHPYCYKYIQ